MLLHDSRRAARTSPEGELVLLDEQDRALWNREQSEEGLRLVRRALESRPAGPFALQAAIAAVHAEQPADWRQIVALYGLLLRIRPSPVIELNRAAAIALSDSAAAGLALMDAISGLDDYQPMHASRAELLRRLGRSEEARIAYERALRLTHREAERLFLERRVRELSI